MNQGADPFDTDLETDFEVDFTEMAEVEPSVGEDYTFVCTDVLANVGRQSGIPKLEFVFRLHADAEGKQPKGGLKCKGWESSVHCSRSKAAAWKMEEVLVALDLCAARGKAKFTREDARGRLVLGHVGKTVLNGRERLQIEYVGVPKQPGKKIKVEEISDDVPF
jgi:hypothetical protein